MKLNRIIEQKQKRDDWNSKDKKPPQKQRSEAKFNLEFRKISKIPSSDGKEKNK